MNHLPFHARRAWFDNVAEDISGEKRTALLGALGVTCPCCGYPLLLERGLYEICLLCHWEDDGCDDDSEGQPGDLDRAGGPNRRTLRQARAYFEEHCVTQVSGGRVFRGLNDAEAIENNRRTIWALDALVDAPDAAAVHGISSS